MGRSTPTPKGPSEGQTTGGNSSRDGSGDVSLPKGVPPPHETVPASTMALWLDMSERSVREHAAQGHLVRGGRGYDLQASVRAFVGHLRTVAAGRGGEDHSANLTAERARLAKEQADAIAMKNEAARGNLLDAGETERVWTAHVIAVRNRILAVPARLRMSHGYLDPLAYRALDRELRDALTALGHGDTTPDREEADHGRD